MGGVGDGRAFVTDDRYQRRRNLGTGGMARVFEAWDTQLERSVAIKEPRSDSSADPGFNDRFLAEARRLARVRHPHVVEIYDVDAQHDPPRMIMEVADAGSLRERLLAGPVPPSRAIAIARQLLTGLAAIHEAGLVHRDLKPENILGFGEIYKIADFGIAKRDHERTQRYVTPKYAAPEVQSGRRSGPRADVYALGLIAYEMVVGSRRFSELVTASWSAADRAKRDGASESTGSEASVSWSAWHRDPDLVLPRLERVPSEVADVVARMTAKRPSERFAHGAAALAALGRSVPAIDRLEHDVRTETVPEPVDDEASTWDLDELRRAAGDPATPRPAGPSLIGWSRWVPLHGAALGLGLAALGAAVALGAFMGMTREEPPPLAPPPQREEMLDLSRLGPSAEAVRLIDDALASRPDDPDLLEAGIHHHFQLANYGRAEALVARLGAVRGSDDPVVDYHRGLVALARSPQRPTAAVQQLERAAGRPAVPSDAYFYLGFARMQGGDRAGAADAFRRFLARDDASEALAERARRFLSARAQPAHRGRDRLRSAAGAAWLPAARPRVRRAARPGRGGALVGNVVRALQGGAAVPGAVLRARLSGARSPRLARHHGIRRLRRGRARQLSRAPDRRRLAGRLPDLLGSRRRAQRAPRPRQRPASDHHPRPPRPAPAPGHGRGGLDQRPVGSPARLLPVTPPPFGRLIPLT